MSGEREAEGGSRISSEREAEGGSRISSEGEAEGGSRISSEGEAEGGSRMRQTASARIPPGGFRELGLVNWAFCKIAARTTRVPQVHIFTTLGQHKRLFWAWLPFGAVLLGFGKLPRVDTELVILRVGQLRGCEYELQQHRRIARRRGLDSATQASIFEGPRAPGLTDRQRALVTAVDELIGSRTLSDETWTALRTHLNTKQLIEFIMLAGQYDALAATLVALKVPLDYAE